MTLRKLDKTEWHAFFDHMAKGLAGKRAEIQVASLALGTQVEAEWLPLLGIAYDPKSDIVEVTLDGVDHIIHKPRDLHVDLDAGGLTGLEVIDDQGVRQIIALRDPLMLPPPSAARRNA